ncbi:MAG: T9SS type A sorting domain-containing protein [Flavobacteriaceae bacterium]|nr:T9SS type A sorting domain-containing protein [Flavobacteriaceae bacterium]
MKTIKSTLIILLLILSAGVFAQQTYIYVSDAGGFNNSPWQIMRYDVDGSNPQIFIPNTFFVTEGVGWPQDIVFLEDQEVVLISNLVGGRITKHNATTGAYIEDFAAVAGGPTRMKIGADDLLYVLQWSNTDNKVLRYEQDGTFVDEFTSVGVVQSIGLDWDSAGNLYVSSYGGGTVRKFDPSGNDMGLFIDTELSGPTNIWFNSGGELLVLDWTAGDIERFDASGNYLGTWASGLAQPEGIAELPNGNLLVGNGGLAQVDQFLPSGTFFETTVTSGSGGLIQPNAVVLRDAILSTSDYELNRILVTPTMGTQFEFTQQAISHFQEIQIFDVLGTLVDSVSIAEGSIWDAQRLSEGIYFMVATGESGLKTTQKIVVKK